MGGVGSSYWYRFDKKTTTGECQRVDLRYLHKEGWRKPGSGFSPCKRTSENDPSGHLGELR